MTTFINLPGASAQIWLWGVGAKAVSTFYGRITDTMRMDPLARLHGGIASRDLPAFQINDMTTFISLPGASAKIWLWSVGAKAVSTFYGRMTDAMRTDPFARLHKKVESVSGLACFSKQRYDNFHQSTRGVDQNMALVHRGSGRIYLLRTHDGRYAYGPVREAT
ncbi:hypothetical protein GN958_ATG07528 [Phytophthora infestans]|uniref:Uncharacterized protein n=1 Tax=Phytophthora infestans TaxID=4787 RepID=A0A8S9URG8_PHYIN|nr:hypothetical protein GN958_ATG07528 [Phytophthora infestans]